VYIGDKEVSLDTVNAFDSGKDHVLKVTSPDGAELKGVLVLLSKESVDLTAGLLDSEDLPTYQRNSRCSSDNPLVGGVTHRDSTGSQKLALGCQCGPAKQCDRLHLLPYNIQAQCPCKDCTHSQVSSLWLVGSERILSPFALRLDRTNLLVVQG
jgi:hypothetical protein